jgi:hypothetical protein
LIWPTDFILIRSCKLIIGIEDKSYQEKLIPTSPLGSIQPPKTGHSCDTLSDMHIHLNAKATLETIKITSSQQQITL